TLRSTSILAQLVRELDALSVAPRPRARLIVVGLSSLDEAQVLVCQIRIPACASPLGNTMRIRATPDPFPILRHTGETRHHLRGQIPVWIVPRYGSTSTSPSSHLCRGTK